MNEMILQYLQKTYNTEFLPCNKTTMNMFESTIEIQVYPKSGNIAADSFYAQYIPLRHEFHDGYYGICAARSLEAYIIHHLSGNAKCVAWFSDKYFDDNLPTDYPIEKAFEEKQIHYTHLEIFSTESIDSEELLKLADTLKIVGVMNMYTIAEPGDYEKLDHTNYTKYVIRSYTANPDISVEKYKVGE